MSNANLNAAKKAKNDEFYTMYEDIENELQHYPGVFQGKTVYCNCDNPEWSNFWKYFHENFAALGLKKLVSTYYEKDVDANGHPYKMEYEGGDDANIAAGVKTPLKGNGDFASDECIEILRQADIVVTNPPFSVFRAYIQTLFDNEKRFIIIGNQQAIKYKNVFPHIKRGKVSLGYTSPKAFLTINKENKNGYTTFNGGFFKWFTTETDTPPHRPLILSERYSPDKYRRYDNFDAINVDKTKDIPIDYTGIIGVPISFMDKYDTERFELIGHTYDMNGDGGQGVAGGGLYINSKAIYTRVFIRNRHPEP